MKRFCVFFAFIFLFLSSSFADYNSLNIPDSAEIRRTILETWLSSPISEVRRYEDELRLNKIGEEFQIRLEENGEEVCIIVAPRSVLDVNLINGDSLRTVRAAVYPKGALGSWILYRDIKTGNPLRVEWHFVSDPEVFIQFRTDGKKTLADLLVFGSFVAHSIPLGIPLERLFTASFQEVINWTEKTVPWNEVLAPLDSYNDTIVMASMIKDNLASILFMDDACYDEVGKLRSITTGELVSPKDEFGVPLMDNSKHTLSGAGFLKWIIDGMVEPITGRGTKISDLVMPTSDFDPVGKMGVMSQEWNLMFTLDWCRNLAAASYSSHSRRDVSFENAGVDVNKDFFALDLAGNSVIGDTGYLKNSGYKIEVLKPILYVLAVTEPSYFYLVAIRQPSYIKPDELVFNNCAVIFPYFANNGKFGCFIFEQGEEISLEDFLKRHQGTYIHLERVKSTDSFFPYEKK